ncbi:MAG: hypothetical protein Ta2B_14470 [Termitinemataceae bacterium]|nr:MAG: hypothetical protein Ta2B_14470 [Termitinemataceae bacterium]
MKMKEKPILFSTAMVQSLLNTKPNTYPSEPIDARKPCKGMTRRVAPFEVCGGQNIRFTGYEVDKGVKGGKEGYCLYSRGIGAQWETRSNVIFPKYQIGNVLWVRETWSDFYDHDTPFIYKADEDRVSDEFRWKPSIFMPREAARIFLKVHSVRLERLRKISCIDKVYEGFCDCARAYPCTEKDICKNNCFMKLWDTLNAKRGYGWDTNPYVWVYEFERIEV